MPPPACDEVDCVVQSDVSKEWCVKSPGGEDVADKQVSSAGATLDYQDDRGSGEEGKE